MRANGGKAAVITGIPTTGTPSVVTGSAAVRAATPGPQQVSALAWVGNVAVVTVPQTHARRCARCSIAVSWIGGRSNTRRSAHRRSAHRAGHHRRTGTPPGRGRRSRPDPVAAPTPSPCPLACFPGLRPDDRRSDRGGGLTNASERGGFEEFCEFFPRRASNSVTRVDNCSTRADNSTINRSRSTSAASRSVSTTRSRATCSASCSYDGDPDTPPASPVTRPV